MLVKQSAEIDTALKGKILRVFSKAVEKKDFPGPKFDTDIFPKEGTDAKCDQDHQVYALHHIIRSRNPNIGALDAELRVLECSNKIPSQEFRNRYSDVMHTAECEVLKTADIVLCTCNEAASRRITENLKPKYVIIDECAMVMEPECMIPIRLAEHVVLIGDHKQLQPVIECRQAELMGLGTSLFQRYVEKVGVEPLMLDTQYRMVRMKHTMKTIKYATFYIINTASRNLPISIRKIL